MVSKTSKPWGSVDINWWSRKWQLFPNILIWCQQFSRKSCRHSYKQWRCQSLRQKCSTIRKRRLSCSTSSRGLYMAWKMRPSTKHWWFRWWNYLHSNEYSYRMQQLQATWQLSTMYVLSSILRWHQRCLPLACTRDHHDNLVKQLYARSMGCLLWYHFCILVRREPDAR